MLSGIERAMAMAVRLAAGPSAHLREVHDDLIATVIQRRPAVYISCATIMIMSVTAALITRRPWAFGWLAIDALLISYRLYLSFRHDNGRDEPVEGRAAVVGSMFVLFVIFGLGCSLCIVNGPPVLMLMAIISTLGMFTGIASRWAGLPGLALLTIVLVALPVCVATSRHFGGGVSVAAVQFAMVAVVTATQMIQNHRMLVRMILAEQQNALLARSDALTGLGNRVRLREDMERLFRPGRRRWPVAVMYLDLDGFKGFNDRHGHDAGDALLRQVGIAIRDEAKGASVYRMGGDEFVVVCSRHEEAAVVPLARRIIDTVSTVRLDGVEAASCVAASVGVALARHADEPASVLARADEAMYAAKRAGKARCHMAAIGDAAGSIAA
ncbi:GGDEF domain-containing protein [Sphingomonas endophytica]|uniref:GGDEF domain-containing protein n=1 Tax=Sphingomonas endophytica TaxID=869719 RepID=UPI000735F3FB|nr:GGDEF domain-containing protein [Sphingomonas endophytica]